jgi:hypothetical protein
LQKLERLKENKSISEEEFTKLKNELIYPSNDKTVSTEFVSDMKTDIRTKYVK